MPQSEQSVPKVQVSENVSYPSLQTPSEAVEHVLEQISVSARKHLGYLCVFDCLFVCVCVRECERERDRNILQTNTITDQII